jgi:hypothetical protein
MCRFMQMLTHGKSSELAAALAGGYRFPMLLGMGTDMHTASIFLARISWIMRWTVMCLSRCTRQRAEPLHHPQGFLKEMSRHIVIIGAEKRATLERLACSQPQTPIAADSSSTDTWARRVRRCGTSYAHITQRLRIVSLKRLWMCPRRWVSNSGLSVVLDYAKPTLMMRVARC